MSDWSLTILLESLHDKVQQELSIVRKAIGHDPSKGDGSEEAWLELFNLYLPKRYRADRAHVVDSKGEFSEQIDVVVYDQQYSPFVFNFKKQIIVPAESVYALFECKQTLDADIIKYAHKKISSVRRLHRTSLPIPHAGGEYPAKPPIHILGGVLSLESEWSPPLGKSLIANLEKNIDESLIDIGCSANHGYFSYENSKYDVVLADKAATIFLFKLISKLQSSATVPMIDIEAYSAWLNR